METEAGVRLWRLPWMHPLTYKKAFNNKILRILLTVFPEFFSRSFSVALTERQTVAQLQYPRAHETKRETQAVAVACSYQSLDACEVSQWVEW